MRLTMRHRKLCVGRISRRIAAAIALCGAAMPAMAAAVELTQTLPPLWASAAALSLALATAAHKPKI
jgi:hypothetical protein